MRAAHVAPGSAWQLVRSAGSGPHCEISVSLTVKGGDSHAWFHQLAHSQQLLVIRTPPLHGPEIWALGNAGLGVCDSRPYGTGWPGVRSQGQGAGHGHPSKAGPYPAMGLEHSSLPPRPLNPNILSVCGLGLCPLFAAHPWTAAAEVTCSWLIDPSGKYTLASLQPRAQNTGVRLSTACPSPPPFRPLLTHLAGEKLPPQFPAIPSPKGVLGAVLYGDT